MKKLMIAAAVAAVGLGASALESANVVGYQSQSAASKPALTGGMAFRTTGASDKTFKLNDIALSGSTYGADWIGFVNPTTSALDSSKNVTYYTPAESIADYGDASYAGWYDITDADKGDVTYPCGTAFLANFTSPNVTVTYAGEVLKGENTVNCAGKPAWEKMNGTDPLFMHFGLEEPSMIRPPVEQLVMAPQNTTRPFPGRE